MEITFTDRDRAFQVIAEPLQGVQDSNTSLQFKSPCLLQGFMSLAASLSQIRIQVRPCIRREFSCKRTDVVQDQLI